MYADVNVRELDKKVELTIIQNKPLIYKLALWLITLLLIPFAIFTLIVMINYEKSTPQFLLALSIILIIFIFVIKHLKIVYAKEWIVIDSEKLTYKNTFLGLGKYFEIRTKDIKKIKYVGYNKQIKHDLETKNDSHGFGITQSEFSYLNEKGTLLLVSEHYKLRFGLNVAEEDCQLLLRLTEKFH